MEVNSKHTHSLIGVRFHCIYANVIGASVLSNTINVNTIKMVYQNIYTHFIFYYIHFEISCVKHSQAFKVYIFQNPLSTVSKKNNPWRC